ncbi:hypothetical protein TIFTF001_016107 [Ficus carica]|uniref:Uncharacterized protein n=1 Tax=Ficus carica TaxID=3494 RepID=A0AA88AA05_FICCA|nr:hypothetical protein TIFTF001_016107 [Ficus carica]
MRVRVGFRDRTLGWVLVLGVGVGVRFLDKGQVWVLGPNWGRISGPELGSCFGTKIGFRIGVRVGVRVGFQYWGSRSSFWTEWGSGFRTGFGTVVEVRFLDGGRGRVSGRVRFKFQDRGPGKVSGQGRDWVLGLGSRSSFGLINGS